MTSFQKALSIILLQRTQLLLSCLLALFVLPAGAAQAGEDTAKPANLKILCTTFPLWLITRNVTQGREGLTVDLLISAQLGCPHDYALTPQDMQKLAGAQVLIVNGRGMEEFLGAPLRNANAAIKVIDSSATIPAGDILNYTADHPAEAVEKQDHDHGKAPAQEGKEHEHGEHHHHSGVNPHLFVSPRLTGLLAAGIVGGLGELDPAGKGLYQRNAQAFAQKMNRLAEEFAALGKKLANNRIVTQHGAFDYLAKEAGLEIVAVVSPHAGEEPSAAEMLHILKEVKEEKAGAVFTEPQYPAKIGQTIATEAGIKTAILDPVASGPENVGLDYYETVMRKNLQTLAEVLGTK